MERDCPIGNTKINFIIIGSVNKQNMNYKMKNIPNMNPNIYVPTYAKMYSYIPRSKTYNNLAG
jgi:hypothetical protein